MVLEHFMEFVVDSFQPGENSVSIKHFQNLINLARNCLMKNDCQFSLKLCLSADIKICIVSNFSLKIYTTTIFLLLNVHMPDRHGKFEMFLKNQSGMFPE